MQNAHTRTHIMPHVCWSKPCLGHVYCVYILLHSTQHSNTILFVEWLARCAYTSHTAVCRFAHVKRKLTTAGWIRSVKRSWLCSLYIGSNIKLYIRVYVEILQRAVTSYSKEHESIFSHIHTRHAYALYSTVCSTVSHMKRVSLVTNRWAQNVNVLLSLSFYM